MTEVCHGTSCLLTTHRLCIQFTEFSMSHVLRICSNHEQVCSKTSHWYSTLLYEANASQTYVCNCAARHYRHRHTCLMTTQHVYIFRSAVQECGQPDGKAVPKNHQCQKQYKVQTQLNISSELAVYPATMTIHNSEKWLESIWVCLREG